ncbi:MAG TPA: hypothetical protein DEB09_05100 [Candidatus Magasanikbacteria bacterium]|nr:hypothetical protein [Candidatus Magasanikbacteria bacterium]
MYFIKQKKVLSFFIIIIGFLAFLPLKSVQAVDARCWTEKDCWEFRRQELNLPQKEAENGFYSGADAAEVCGKEINTGKDKTMGFCLPVGQTNTSIKFGGKNNFAHLGDFIQYIYRYGVVVVGLLAVFMIIRSGLVWVTSGGSAEKIKEAQKLISGSIIGLIIALLSYSLLNVLNPNLVNLRMPQIWLINKRLAPQEFCKDLSGRDNEKFLIVGNKDTVLTEDSIKEKLKDPSGGAKKAESYTIIYDTKDKVALKTNFSCGNQLVYVSGGADVCRGDYCTENENTNKTSTYTCLKDFSSDKPKYGCKKAIIWGHVVKPLLAAFDWSWDFDSPTLVNDFDLYVVCDSGRYFPIPNFVDSIFFDGTNMSYITSASTKDLEEGANDCGNKENVAGFVLNVDLDETYWPVDEAHFIGVDSGNKTRSFDLGNSSVSTGFFNSFVKDSYDGGGGGKPKEFLLSPSILDGESQQLDIYVGEIKFYN